MFMASRTSALLLSYVSGAGFAAALGEGAHPSMGSTLTALGGFLVIDMFLCGLHSQLVKRGINTANVVCKRGVCELNTTPNPPGLKLPPVLRLETQNVLGLDPIIIQMGF